MTALKKQVRNQARVWLCADPLFALDEDAAVPLAELHEEMERCVPEELSLEALRDILSSSRSFELLGDGAQERVRARSGHARHVFAYPEATPLVPLYVAVTARQADILREHGIPEGDGYHELYVEREQAARACRAKRPVIFEVDGTRGALTCYRFCGRWWVAEALPEQLLEC